jgi:hypothetical protein
MRSRQPPKSDNEATVRLLLDRGADVNAQGGYYGNALQAAAQRSGNEATVRLLLDRGADVNAQGGCYGNALQAAAERSGNEATVRLLLDRGADVNAQGGELWQCAPGSRHSKAIMKPQSVFSWTVAPMSMPRAGSMAMRSRQPPNAKRQ